MLYFCTQFLVKCLNMKKYKFLFLIFLIVVCFVCSCKNNKKKGEIEKVLSEWIGKEILFPENVPCYMAGKDTLTDICNKLFQKEFKILMYVDSAGCSSCRLKLFEWKQLMEEADSLFQGKVGFLLFFQPKTEREMSYLFALNRFDYSAYMDINGAINRLNRFPKAMEYQCFLLDSNNKVLMVGNPVLNLNIWKLYKTQIGGNKNTDPETLTTTTVDKMVHDYGAILKGSSNTAVFTITNTGDHPLVIYRVLSSCGCTNVDWNKQPVESGQTVTVRVEMVPDETGFFNKTIDIYCNTRNSPIRLMVNGNAKE